MKFAEAAPDMAVAGLDVSAVGAYPLLQLFGGLLVLTIGVLAYVRGARDKQALPPPAAMHESLEIRLGGPLMQILRCLDESARALQRIEEGQRATVTELEKCGRGGEDVRGLLRANNVLLDDVLRELRELGRAKRARDRRG